MSVVANSQSLSLSPSWSQAPQKRPFRPACPNPFSSSLSLGLGLGLTLRKGEARRFLLSEWKRGGGGGGTDLSEELGGERMGFNESYFFTSHFEIRTQIAKDMYALNVGENNSARAFGESYTPRRSAAMKSWSSLTHSHTSTHSTGTSPYVAQQQRRSSFPFASTMSGCHIREKADLFGI